MEIIKASLKELLLMIRSYKTGNSFELYWPRTSSRRVHLSYISKLREMLLDETLSLMNV